MSNISKKCSLKDRTETSMSPSLKTRLLPNLSENCITTDLFMMRVRFLCLEGRQSNAKDRSNEINFCYCPARLINKEILRANKFNIKSI